MVFFITFLDNVMLEQEIRAKLIRLQADQEQLVV